MTVEQAKTALTLAPCDGLLSAVEPNMKRRDVVYHASRILNAIPITVIDVPTVFARHVAAVVQDCADPVELRFIYEAGEIVVGWNKEEVEMRKGLRPKPGAIPLGELIRAGEIEQQKAMMNYQPNASQLQQMAELQRNMNAQQSLHYYEMIRDQLARAAGPTIALTLNQLADVLGHFAPKAAPAEKPAPAPQPKPDKVDPSDPKFVLKRPKL
jgi:hypothetical protein